MKYSRDQKLQKKTGRNLKSHKSKKKNKLKMNKLITTIGSMLFVCMIFISCSSDKKSEENKAPKLTEIQKDYVSLANAFCDMFVTGNIVEDIEKKMEYAEGEEYEEIYEKYEIAYEKNENAFKLYMDLAKNLEIKWKDEKDNLDIAKKDFAFFKKQCETCKEEIEKSEGWDNLWDSYWKDIASGYDGNGNPIEEDLDYGWSEFDQNNFLDDCNSENEMDMTAYCDCALEIVMSMYESYDEANELMTDDDVMEVAEACSYALDVTEGWSELEQNVFVQSCIAENDADFMPAYCDCALDIVMSMYDSPEEAELMTEDDFMEIAEACSYTFDM